MYAIMDCLDAEDLAIVSCTLAPMLVVLLSGVFLFGIRKNQTTHQQAHNRVMHGKALLKQNNNDSSDSGIVATNYSKRRKWRTKRSSHKNHNSVIVTNHSKYQRISAVMNWLQKHLLPRPAQKNSSSFHEANPNMRQQKAYLSNRKHTDNAIINSSSEDLTHFAQNMKKQKFRQKGQQATAAATNNLKNAYRKRSHKDIQNDNIKFGTEPTCNLKAPKFYAESSNNANIAHVQSFTDSPCCSTSSLNSQESDRCEIYSFAPTSYPGLFMRVPRRNKSRFIDYKQPIKQLAKLEYNESELVLLLRQYLIEPTTLRKYGFPVESAEHKGCVEIYKATNYDQIHQQNKNHRVINSNDGLHHAETTYLLEDAKHDSGQGSDSNTTPTAMDSDGSELTEDDTTSEPTAYGTYQLFSQYQYSQAKQCVRCKSSFHVNDAGEYLQPEECIYHWGKLYQICIPNVGYKYQYSCCKSDQSSVGCMRNNLHVWTGVVAGINGPYKDFVSTRARSKIGEIIQIYALDCEMSFTGRGLELTKVTIVGYDGLLVYEKFVRPDAQIVDYNTRFSGVSAKDLCKQTNYEVKSLSEIQTDLLQFIFEDTILIGHNIDNDLRVLRILHKTIIDTSVIFPHAHGFPFRCSLKSLTRLHLHRDIQCDEKGHNSFEDSRASLELILWKLSMDLHESDSMC